MILHLIIGGIVGFIIGALVFRNNQKKGEALIQKLEDLIKKQENKNV